MNPVGLRECVRALEERRKTDASVPKLSVSTLSRQVAAGIIPNHADAGAPPKVDVDEVIASRANIDPSKQRGAAAPLGSPDPEASLFAGGDADSPADNSKSAGGVRTGGGASYQKARTAREAIAARKAHIDLEEKLGNLVDRQEAIDLFFDLAAALREGLESRVPLLAGRLAGMTDPSAISSAIADDDRKLLERMADEFKRRFIKDAHAAA